MREKYPIHRNFQNFLTLLVFKGIMVLSVIQKGMYKTWIKKKRIFTPKKALYSLLP